MIIAYPILMIMWAVCMWNRPTSDITPTDDDKSLDEIMAALK